MVQWAQNLGKWLLLLGIGMTVLGGALFLGSKALGSGGFGWLGRLPGDIRVEREGFSCYFPLVTGILVSLLLTIVLNIVVRLLRR